MTSILLSLVYGGVVLTFLGALGLVSGEWHWFFQMHQPWLILIALITFVVFHRQRPSYHALMFAAAFPMAVACVSMWTLLGYSAYPVISWQNAADNWGKEWEAWSFGLITLVFLYASLLTVCVVIWPPNPKDVMAKGMCLFLWIGELYMLAENWLCNIALPTAGSAVLEGKISGEGSIYACGRVIGEWVVWGPTSMQLAVMAWLVWMHAKAKHRNGSP